MTLKSILGGYVESLFAVADKRVYWTPEKFNLISEERLIDTKDGNQLSVWTIPNQGSNQTVGTVFYLHPMLHNMSYNLLQVAWLVKRGFNVVTFDYQGFGSSSGSFHLNGCVDDAECVFNAVSKFFPKTDSVLFGQGVGADVALRLSARTKKGVRGLILESLYGSCEDWLLNRYGPGVGHLARYLMPHQTSRACDVLAKTKLPVALLYPLLDNNFAPLREREQVLRAAPKQAQIWGAKNKGYLGIFLTPSQWNETFVQFCTDVLR